MATWVDDAVPASPGTGVDTISGAGLAEVMAGADVVVDVSNAPVWEDDAVRDFFVTSTRNQLAAEREAGVGHHLAVSIVGAERLPDSGYLRAKVAQEAEVEAGGVPFTILRSTQFFEFVNGIIKSAGEGTIRLSPALLQPIASDDVVAALADITVGAPLNSTVEVAGPEKIPLDKLARKYLAANHDERQVIADVHARYFGTELNDQSLTPGQNPRIGAIRFEEWLGRSSVPR